LTRLEELPEKPPRPRRPVHPRGGSRRDRVGAGQGTTRIRSLPFDLLRYEFFMTLTAVSDHVLEEIVDTIFLPLILRPGPA
jgi:hypothetical protein